MNYYGCISQAPLLFPPELYSQIYNPNFNISLLAGRQNFDNSQSLRGFYYERQPHLQFSNQFFDDKYYTYSCNLRTDAVLPIETNEIGPNSFLETKVEQYSYFNHSPPESNIECEIPKSEEGSSKKLKIEDSYCKVESGVVTDSCKTRNPLKKQISNMILFFIKSFGKVSQSAIDQEKMKYSSSSSLTEVFDILCQKYAGSVKSRDDMMRFSLRKALAFMRDTIKQELNINSKQASLVFCKKCFLDTGINKITNQIDVEVDKVEDMILSFFLPYKKNSRNKTPNFRFMNEAFLSEDFLQYYQNYLSRFSKIMKTDNQKKIQKLADCVFDCLTNQTTSQIKNFKRLPWTESWIETMQIIAHELLDFNTIERSTLKRMNKNQQNAFNLKIEQSI